MSRNNPILKINATKAKFSKSLSRLAGAIIVMGLTMTTAMAAIIVQGNTRVDASSVRETFLSGSNGATSASALDDGLKALYATGLYEDVSVTGSGGNIVIRVAENPIVSSVTFSGNKKLKDDALASEIQTRVRGVLTDAKLQSDVQRIRELYRASGRYGANVDVKTTSQAQNRVDVVFNISEGDKTKIRKINFVGNKAFSSRKLRDVVSTTQSNLFSWVKTSDVYDQDRLNADKELLRRFYLEHGFADAEIYSAVADFNEEENAYYITFTLEEGKKYQFGNIDVESTISTADAKRYKRLIKTRSGRTFDAKDVEQSMESVSLAVSEDGSPFANIRLRGDRDYENNKINLTYVIEQGQPIYVERINIRGNTRTMDQVIRREFDFSEGDAFNRVMVRRAERRLNELGYFKSVRLTESAGSTPDRVVLNVDVEEQPTGEISFGAGYSSNEGVMGDIGVTENNFLGRGQYVKVGAGLGESSQSFDFKFTEPYFLGHRISAGFDIYTSEQQDTDTISYSNSTQGGGVHMGFPISDDLSFSMAYKFFRQDIKVPAVYKDTNLVNGEASKAIILSEGETDTSLVSFALLYNTVDSAKRPTEGIYARFMQEFAGLGGDVKFVRTTAEARIYHTVFDDFVFMLKGQGGHIAGLDGDDVRLMDSFFKGATLVRGFDSAGLGPRDTSTINNDALGGTIYYAATAELSFPFFGLPEELGLVGAVFADAGTLYNVGELGAAASSVTLQDDDSLRASIGASVIWHSPFGPLRFDYAHVLKDEWYDKNQAFRFSAGKAF